MVILTVFSIFRTALSKSILPFGLFQPDLIVLPIIVERQSDGLKRISLHSADYLRNEGYLNASNWFTNTENFWIKYRTEKSEKMSSNDRLDFQRGIVEQDLNRPYLVLYNSSAKDANATVVKREDFNIDFIVESVTYVLYTINISEAYYLAAILNSSAPNELIKDFQAKGLFGARHVHKKILDVYFPRFNDIEVNHIKLAELSLMAHKKVSKYLIDNQPKQELSSIHLGRLRTEIKKHLLNELKEIDNIVKKII